MTAPRLYFRHLRIADEVAGELTSQLEFDQVEWQTAGDFARGNDLADIGARYRIEATCLFSREGTAETDRVFWNRIRAMNADMRRALKRGNDVDRFGPLVLVRDEDGSTFAQGKDRSVTTTAHAGSGSAVVTLDDVPTEWLVGDNVLLIHDASPALYSEIAEVTALDAGANTITVTTEHAYDIGSIVLRAHWHFPSVALVSTPNLPLWGFPDQATVADIRVTFEGATDVVSEP